LRKDWTTVQAQCKSVRAISTEPLGKLPSPLAGRLVRPGANPKNEEMQMFKKSLAAVAVLGAFAGSALAADVQLYGLVDLGLNWTQVDNGKTTTDSFGMGSGQNSGSRFGLKGTEDLGNGYKVGFNLENSFKADDGAFDKGSRLFHRESILFVQTPYGELSAGRTGGLDSGVGRYGQMGSGATAMSTGWDNIAKTSKVFLGLGDRMDNTLTYQSPKFAGVTVLAQASLKKSNVNDKGVAIETEEGSSDADRYYALGVTYGAGALNAGLVYSQTDWNRTELKDQTNDDNQTVVSAFANYDFGMVKPMVAVQYFDGGKDVDVANTALNKGYGFVVGGTAPLVGGTLKVQLGWNDYEDVKTGATEGNNIITGVGYEYPLSKRTFVYTAAGYTQVKTEKAGVETKTKTSEVMLGMVHKF
jgi:predicted porin